MTFANFDIHLPAAGRGARIVVNGEDVSDRCSRVAVESAAGEVTRVYLTSFAEGRIQGEGVVEVRIPADVDQREAVLEFLDNLDPSVIEQEVLASMGGLDGGSTGEAFLTVLKGYVRGDGNGS